MQIERTAGAKTSRRLRTMAAAATTLAAFVFAGNALAAEPNQVTGLTAVQHDGYATLAWDPVAGATDYQIERTPVDDANVPTDVAVVTGVWQPQRTITPDVPRFADAGFALGGRYEWRVRARFGTKPRSSRRVHAFAWWSSAAPTRSRAVPPRRGTGRSTCSSWATRRRLRRRRRSRTRPRSSTTATSTATSRKDASRA